MVRGVSCGGFAEATGCSGSVDNIKETNKHAGKTSKCPVVNIGRRVDMRSPLAKIRRGETLVLSMFKLRQLDHDVTDAAYVSLLGSGVFGALGFRLRVRQ